MAEQNERTQPGERRFTIDAFTPDSLPMARLAEYLTQLAVLLASHGKQTTGCHADRTTAKKLGRHLFEPVRLYGEGQWSRGTDGAWEVDRFKIERFEPLDGAKLSDVLSKLRAVAANWDDDMYLDLEAVPGAGEP